MNPRIKKVYPNDDYTLRIIFENNEEKIFDVEPYLDKGIFKQLKDLRIFNSINSWCPFIKNNTGISKWRSIITETGLGPGNSLVSEPNPMKGRKA